jgi:hypothetical protein
MNSYDAINKQLNDEMQELAEKINRGNYTEKDRNRLATIMYPKLKYSSGSFLTTRSKLRKSSTTHFSKYSRA